MDQTELRLDGLGIRRIKEVPPNIEVISVGGNCLRNLGAVTTCSSLQELDLSGNRFDESALAPLAELPRLRILNLARNLLKDLRPLFSSSTAQAFPALEALDLSGNSALADVAPALAAPRLRTLTAASLALTEVQCRPSATLEVLDLRRCCLNALTGLTALGSLRELLLDGNAMLACDDVSAHSLLQTLQLGHNAISKVPALRLPSLTSLDVAANDLGDLPVMTGTPCLSSFSLCENAVVSLSPLACLRNLTILDASHNQLTCLEPCLAGALQQLRVLLLAGNRIECWDDVWEALQPSHSPGSPARLEHLDLRDNPLTLAFYPFQDLPVWTWDADRTLKELESLGEALLDEGTRVARGRYRARGALISPSLRTLDGVLVERGEGALGLDLDEVVIDTPGRGMESLEPSPEALSWVPALPARALASLDAQREPLAIRPAFGGELPEGAQPHGREPATRTVATSPRSAIARAASPDGLCSPWPRNVFTPPTSGDAPRADEGNSEDSILSPLGHHHPQSARDPPRLDQSPLRAGPCGRSEGRTPQPAPSPLRSRPWGRSEGRQMTPKAVEELDVRQVMNSSMRMEEPSSLQLQSGPLLHSEGRQMTPRAQQQHARLQSRSLSNRTEALRAASGSARLRSDEASPASARSLRSGPRHSPEDRWPSEASPASPAASARSAHMGRQRSTRAPSPQDLSQLSARSLHAGPWHGNEARVLTPASGRSSSSAGPASAGPAELWSAPPLATEERMRTPGASPRTAALQQRMRTPGTSPRRPQQPCAGDSRLEQSLELDVRPVHRSSPRTVAALPASPPHSGTPKPVVSEAVGYPAESTTALLSEPASACWGASLPEPSMVHGGATGSSAAEPRAPMTVDAAGRLSPPQLEAQATTEWHLERRGAQDWLAEERASRHPCWDPQPPPPRARGCRISDPFAAPSLATGSSPQLRSGLAAWSQRCAASASEDPDLSLSTLEREETQARRSLCALQDRIQRARARAVQAAAREASPSPASGGESGLHGSGPLPDSAGGRTPPRPVVLHGRPRESSPGSRGLPALPEPSVALSFAGSQGHSALASGGPQASDVPVVAPVGPQARKAIEELLDQQPWEAHGQLRVTQVACRCSLERAVESRLLAATSSFQQLLHRDSAIGGMRLLGPRQSGFLCGDTRKLALIVASPSGFAPVPDGKVLLFGLGLGKAEALAASLGSCPPAAQCAGASGRVLIAELALGRCVTAPCTFKAALASATVGDDRRQGADSVYFPDVGVVALFDPRRALPRFLAEYRWQQGGRGGLQAATAGA